MKQFPQKKWKGARESDLSNWVQHSNLKNHIFRKGFLCVTFVLSSFWRRLNADFFGLQVWKHPFVIIIKFIIFILVSCFSTVLQKYILSHTYTKKGNFKNERNKFNYWIVPIQTCSFKIIARSNIHLYKLVFII